MAVRHRTSIDDRPTPPGDLRADGLPEDVGLGASLPGARLCCCPFRTAAIEKRKRGMDADNAADVAASSVRRLGAGNDFRLRDSQALRRTLREVRRLELARESDEVAA